MRGQDCWSEKSRLIKNRQGIMIEVKIRNILDGLIQLFRENPNRWKSERMVHYEFFRLLSKEFTPEEIQNRFRAEFPVGVPSYGKGKKQAAVDIALFTDDQKFIAVEIEMVGAGKPLRDELEKCVRKLQTDVCQKSMLKGYVVPLLARPKEKTARGYGKSYADVCKEDIERAKKLIGDSPIEIVTEGVIPLSS